MKCPHCGKDDYEHAADCPHSSGCFVGMLGIIMMLLCIPPAMEMVINFWGPRTVCIEKTGEWGKCMRQQPKEEKS